MSWTDRDGASIESPRRPRCRETDAVRDWVRAVGGTKRRARHRAYAAWLLCRVGGMPISLAALGEGTSKRTIERRLEMVETMLDGIREVEQS